MLKKKRHFPFESVKTWKLVKCSPKRDGCEVFQNDIRISREEVRKSRLARRYSTANLDPNGHSQTALAYVFSAGRMA
jgi:hypothetical protein